MPCPAPSSASSGNASTHVRGSLLSAATAAPAGGKKKAKAVDSSQPAFKPRTLKKNPKGETYRDRASERRLGTNNDYAQVCLLLLFSVSASWKEDIPMFLQVCLVLPQKTVLRLILNTDRGATC